MTDERDPDLAVFFAKAEDELPDNGFSAGVETRIRKGFGPGRLMVAGLTALIGILCVALLASTFQFATPYIVDILTRPIVDTEPTPVSFFLSPVNMVAVPVGFGLLCLWLFWRKLFA
jgi:hypothetical protein